jgi:hypothetical protein
MDYGDTLEEIKTFEDHAKAEEALAAKLLQEAAERVEEAQEALRRAAYYRTL